DIKRFLGNEPVVARPPSAAYRFRKLVRRNKLTFAAAAAIAVVLVLGVVTSMWQAVRATQAKQEAVLAQRKESEQRREAVEAGQKEIQERQRAEGYAVNLRRNLYASDMNVAYQSWLAGDAERARTLLTNQIPRAGEEDLRGWEWRHLWGHTRSHELATLEI